MDGVTDAACRFIAKKYGKADISYTEFVSAEGLWRIKKRGEMDHKIWNELKYDELERPVIAQLFGSDPDSFYEAAKILVEMGFDGIDINMGCPSPGLEKREGGAGLMRSRGRAKEVIEATRKGVVDRLEIASSSTPRNDNVQIPVSVKTRLGSATPDPEWWNFLANMELPAVAMHGRTFKQLYAGEADWDVLEEAGKVIRESGAKFLANGDVKKIMTGEEICIDSRLREYPCGNDREEEGVDSCPPTVSVPTENRDLALLCCARNDEVGFGDDRGCNDGRVVLTNGVERSIANFDGVLIGRQALGNPWVLRKDGYEPTRGEKFKVAIEHAINHEQIFPEHFLSVRKHLASYVKGLSDATELRKKLVMAENSVEVEKILSAEVE